jgi:hypothetical protein
VDACPSHRAVSNSRCAPPAHAANTRGRGTSLQPSDVSPGNGVSSHVSPRVVYVHAARKLLLCAYALEVMNPIVNSVCCLIVLMWILGAYVVKIFFRVCAS